MDFDQNSSRAIEHLADRSPAWNAVAIFGARYLLILFLGVSFFLFWQSGHEQIALFLFEALALGYILAVLLSFAIRRRRPYEVKKDMLHMKPFIYTPSFPSGHATAAFAAAGVHLAAAYGGQEPWVLAIIAVVVAALVAFGRVMAGVHYVTDVIGGSILGLLCTGLVGYIAFTL